MKKLLEELAALEKRAAAQVEQIKDGMDDAAVRAIEDEHNTLVAAIADKRLDIAALEAEERKAADVVVAPVAPAIDAVSAEESKRNSADAVAQERQRTSDIQDVAKRFDSADLAEEFVRDGKSATEFKLAVLEKMAERDNKELKTVMGVTGVVGVEASEKRAAAIESAILHRADPSRFELKNGGEDFRGLTLMDMARDSLEVQDVSTRGMARDKIAGMALQRSGGYHGTSDFPTILGNVINATLRSAYEAAPQTFAPLVREVSVSDFKEVKRAQLGEAPGLEAVGENGEFKRGSIGEASESYKIGTFGKIIAINRQTIINDDMNAFGRLPQLFGVQAAQLESDLVWAQILGNPAMGDGQNLFSAAHKNLATASALSITAISKARAAMSKQVGMDKKTVLNIRPSYLIVPVDLETAAEQLLVQTHTPVNAASDVATSSMRSLQIISEPRLDVGIPRYDISADSKAFYFAADKSSTDTIELAYLEGNRGVYTETRAGFDVDGIEMKVRLDVGAKTIESKAFYKNAGV